MPVDFHISLSFLFGFLLVLARVSGMIVLVPIPGLQAAPEAARVIMALTLSFTLIPVWPRPDVSAGTAAMAGFICIEFVYGLLLGGVTALLLEGAQLATQLIGLQAGYSFASTVDPSTQADSAVLQVMVQLFTGFLFFALGLDREIIRILSGTFEVSSHLARGAVLERALADLGSQMFVSGLRLAMPVLALLILVDISFAIMGKVHSQFQTQSLSFASKMLLGLALLSITLGGYPEVLRETATHALDAARHLVAK